MAIVLAGVVVGTTTGRRTSERVGTGVVAAGTLLERLLVDALVGIAGIVAMQLHEEVVIIGREFGRALMLDGLLEIFLGSGVEVLPVTAAAVTGTIVLGAFGLEGQRIAAAVLVVDVSTTGLIASCL